jgi:hypothetical protein
MTTSGSLTSFDLPICGCQPMDMLSVDGKLWLLENVPNHVPFQLIPFDPSTDTFGSAVPIPREYAQYPGPLAVGPDGNIWLSGQGGKFGADGAIAVYLLQSIAAQPKAITFTSPGQSANLSISETNYNGTWSVSSSNPTVATVSRNGPGSYTVSAVGLGSAVIVVKDLIFNSINVEVTVQ